MDNRQTQILLVNYLRQLNDAIKKVEADIPPEMKEKYTDILGFKGERIPALEPIYEFESRIQDDIDSLDE